jgi:hypothetical protein
MVVGRDLSGVTVALIAVTTLLASSCARRHPAEVPPARAATPTVALGEGVRRDLAVPQTIALQATGLTTLLSSNNPSIDSRERWDALARLGVKQGDWVVRLEIDGDGFVLRLRDRSGELQRTGTLTRSGGTITLTATDGSATHGRLEPKGLVLSPIPNLGRDLALLQGAGFVLPVRP